MKGKPVTADPANMGRKGGLANKAAHADDPGYFKRLGRLRGLAKARNHSAEVKAIREAAARGEIG